MESATSRIKNDDVDHRRLPPSEVPEAPRVRRRGMRPARGGRAAHGALSPRPPDRARVVADGVPLAHRRPRPARKGRSLLARPLPALSAPLRDALSAAERPAERLAMSPV